MKTKEEYIGEYAEQMRPQLNQVWDMLGFDEEMKLKLFDAVVEVVSNEYSLEECQLLHSFYCSPMGKAITEKLPAVMAKAQEKGMEIAREHFLFTQKDEELIKILN